MFLEKIVGECMMRLHENSLHFGVLDGAGGCSPLVSIISCDRYQNHAKGENQPQNASGHHESVALIQARILSVSSASRGCSTCSAGAGGGVLLGEV